MKEQLMQECRLRDEFLQLNKIDEKITEQLAVKSKYRRLGMHVINKRTNKPLFIIENLRDTADMNGLRGKNPLCGGKDSYRFKLRKLKENGINTVIDFRDSSLCSDGAKKCMAEMGFKYVSFPISSKWTPKEVKNIAKYIEAVNEGNYIAGCANGQARTDLGMAINYIFNPKAVNIPKFYYGNINRASSVAIRENVEKIYEIIKNNPEIIKSYGWADINEFNKAFGTRFARLLTVGSK